jgi:hypothetical protein
MKSKIILLLVGLLCVVTANATDKTVVLSSGTASGTTIWTTTDNGSTYTFTGTTTDDYVEFSLGDVSSYYDLVLTIASSSGTTYPKMLIKSGTESIYKTWGSNANKTYYWQYNSAASDDNNNLRLSNDNLKNVTLRIYGAATMSFSSIVLHEATMSCQSFKTIDNLTYFNNNKEGTPVNLSNTTITKNTTIYGNNTGSSAYYTDITGYSNLNVEITGITSTSAGVRCRIWTSTDGTNYTQVTPDPSVTLTSVGTATFGLSSYSTASYVRLNFIKAGATSGSSTDVNFTVGNIYLTKDNVKYYISGQKIIASTDLTNAKADASCTAIDVSGVKSLADPSATSMMDLDPTAFTNKNCLFIAPTAAAKLTQNNVIVGTACANLSLVDGSAFNAPVAFTATNATYKINTSSRDMTTKAGTRYGTIILPFAVSGNAAYKFFTVSSANSSQLVLTEAASTKADKPYIFRLNADEGATVSLSDITATNAAVATTPSDLAQTAVKGIALTGSYKAQTITTTDAYYIGKDDKFYKSSGTLTINPFRAYFNGTIDTGAKSLSVGEFGDVTTVNDALSSAALVIETGPNEISFSANKTVAFRVYNANGILIKRISLNTGDNASISVPSGLYIVNGMKVYVK